MAALRGQLFKAGEANSVYRQRWFELVDGNLSWSEQEGGPIKQTVPLRGAVITLDPDQEPQKKQSKKEDDEARYGFRLLPAGSSRVYSLRASSDEERRLWCDALDTAAHPSVHAYRSGTGRIVKLTRPADYKLGIDLGAKEGTPCVTVINIVGSALQSGLLVGDVIVAIGHKKEREGEDEKRWPTSATTHTVVRTIQIAEKAFSRVKPSMEMTLTLSGWNREVRMSKDSGISGLPLSLCAPLSGPGVLVQSISRDSAAAVAGLNVGDRILAVNSRLCESHEQAMDLVRQAYQEVRFVVCGVSVAIQMRKDADGQIGIALQRTAASRAVEGVVVSDVMPRSAAFHAGLRNGDTIIAVDGGLVANPKAAIARLSGAARALSIVVWRDRPDPTPEEVAPQASKQLSAAGAASVQPDSASCLGKVPWPYYSHELHESHETVPMNLPLYEDLTMPAKSGSRCE